MTEHTPTPWVAIEEPYDPEHDLFARSIYSEGYKGKLIARVDQDFSDTDAAFIIRCVNAHAELVAALKACEAMTSTDNGPPNWDWIRSILAKVVSHV